MISMIVPRGDFTVRYKHRPTMMRREECTEKRVYIRVNRVYKYRSTKNPSISINLRLCELNSSNSTDVESGVKTCHEWPVHQIRYRVR